MFFRKINRFVLILFYKFYILSQPHSMPYIKTRLKPNTDIFGIILKKLNIISIRIR